MRHWFHHLRWCKIPLKSRLALLSFLERRWSIKTGKELRKRNPEIQEEYPCYTVFCYCLYGTWKHGVKTGHALISFQRAEESFQLQLWCREAMNSSYCDLDSITTQRRLSSSTSMRAQSTFRDQCMSLKYFKYLQTAQMS